MNKKSMSVREMGRILGLGKTESYWLAKKNNFEVREVAGKMRIMLDSFEEWYASQFHYKKINGELPGSKWTKYFLSIEEVAQILNITKSSVYELLKRNYFKTNIIDNRIFVDKTSFEKWLEGKNREVK